MYPTSRSLALATLSLAAATCQADNCEPLKEQIAEKIRTGGVSSFTLSIVGVGESRSGRVVGTCGQGSKQIVYVQTGVPGGGAGGMGIGSPASWMNGAPAPKGYVPRPPGTRVAAQADAIMTECKDGTVVVGPNCNKPAASGAAAPAKAAPVAR